MNSQAQAQAMAALQTAARDPLRAAELRRLQEQACRCMDDLLHAAQSMLAAADPPSPLPGGGMDLVMLRGAARQRQGRAEERSELALALICGALLNADNPDWDPLDPATSSEDGSAPLLALLQTDLGG
ncbi:hypothetical protein MJ904_08815 [Massilia sp. MB5]|uniref:hypothetical protein n=1 Tax=Massilia sp. MB5 TaxID=2919578 RepID=UPI001F0D14AE|nr:hypothetical protein [Massilia sp. MB5]UMR32252.1 hypothetical protein MJ904_08815 [Massilia sp. MB5]